MKRLYSIILAVAAVLATTACNKEFTVTDTDFTITAVAGVETKTELDGFKVNWLPSDRLGVFDTKGVVEFVTDITSPSQSATFRCSGDFTMPDDLSDAVLVAIYPYDAALTADWGSYSIGGVKIPSTQNAVEGSFDPAAAVSWSAGTFATKDQMQFHNLYSLLKVIVADSDVTEVTLKANGGESLAGVGSVSLLDGSFAISGGSSEVVLKGSFEKGEAYYIAVCPGTYASGFTLLLDGEEVKSTTKEIKLAANHIYDLGEFAPVLEPSEMTWYLAGDFNNWNPADEDYKMEKDGQWFKLTAYLSAGSAVKFYAGSTGVNRGNKTTSYAESRNFVVVQDGNNITVSKTGAYDFFLGTDGDVARVTFIGELPTPDGKQWKFNYSELRGATSIIDLGVTTEGKIVIAYDAEEVYGSANVNPAARGKYTQYMSWDYEIQPKNSSSGIILLVGKDHFGDRIETPAYYSEYDGNTLVLTCEMLYIENVQMTASSRTIQVYVDPESTIG